MANEGNANRNELHLLQASERFVAGWSHFLECIDFGKSWLDAEAIQFMNEVPGEIEAAVEAIENDK